MPNRNRYRAGPPRRAQLTWLAAAAAFCLAALATWKVFWTQDGDAAVYWVYARSMWSDGLFHFGRAPVSYGATSPAWAVVLSLVSLGGAANGVVLWKLAGALAVALLAAMVYALGRIVTGSRTESIAAAALVALHPGLRLFAVSSYETPFFAALVANATLATCLLPRTQPDLRRMAYFLVSLAVLPLGRPEGLVVAGSLAAVTLFRYRSVSAALLLVSTLVPFALFVTWMHSHTGLWIPSSVAARQMMSAVGDTYLRPASTVLVVVRALGMLFEGPASLRLVGYAVQGVLLAAGLLALTRSRPVFAAAYVVVSATMVLGLTTNNPGYYLMRYAMPMLPFAAVAMVHGASVLFNAAAPRLRHAALPVALLAGTTAFGQSIIGTVRAAAGPVRPPIDVLDAEGGTALNGLIGPSDVVLTYEVQTAYHLDAIVVSADGIVGGEILPYLRSRDLGAFIRDQHITHVLTSGAYRYRSVYRNTLLERLASEDISVAVGDVVTYDGVTLRKIAALPRPEDTPLWRGAYAVVRP